MRISETSWSLSEGGGGEGGTDEQHQDAVGGQTRTNITEAATVEEGGGEGRGEEDINIEGRRIR